MPARQRAPKGEYDFKLRGKEGRLYIAEAKCWLAYLEGARRKLELEYLAKVKEGGSLAKFLRGEVEPKDAGVRALIGSIGIS